jgi:hypothetical protein
MNNETGFLATYTSPITGERKCLRACSIEGIVRDLGDIEDHAARVVDGFERRTAGIVARVTDVCGFFVVNVTARGVVVEGSFS